jgi:Tfp pilus assembly protein PilX
MVLKIKKKGSSLVVVLMVFSVLTIFGMAMLSLTLSAFQSRVLDNNSKVNLYFSESGLDVAYGMVGNTVDSAISSGNQAVTAYMNSLNGPNGILQQEQQRFINGQPSAYPKSAIDPSSVYLNTDGSIDESYIKQQQNQIFIQSYQSNIKSCISDWLKNGINIPNGSYNSGETQPLIKVLNNNNIAFSSATQNGILTLQLESTFTDKSIQRTVDINYNIITPNYNDTYYVESNSINLPVQAVWSKAFCIDGDLKIRGSLSVNGDAYVKGNSSGDNGIVINGDSYHVAFTGNLSTAGNFQVNPPDTNTTSPASVSSPKAIDINGNVYTGNMDLTDGTSNINLTVNGSAYTNNDIA